MIEMLARNKLAAIIGGSTGIALVIIGQIYQIPWMPLLGLVAMVIGIILIINIRRGNKGQGE